MTPVIAWILIGAIGIVILFLILLEIQNTNMKVSELSPVLTEVSGALTNISGQLAKATTEIIAAVSDAELPAEVVAKLEGIKTLANDLTSAAQKLDDLNPDPSTPPTP